MSKHDDVEATISKLLDQLVTHISKHDDTEGMLSTTNLASRQSAEIKEKLANLVRYANARGN